MKKKILALICLAITVVMCFSSCTVLTRITSLFDKGGNTNSANEGDPNCTHLWSNGYVDTECETSKDAVLKTECYFCGKQLFTDIRTTITEEEFENIYNNEFLLPNFTIMYVEKDSSEDEIFYELADENGVCGWDKEEGFFRFQIGSDGSSEGDTANNYYVEALDYIGVDEYFFAEYPFELFSYDENQKCYVYSMNDRIIVDYDFITGNRTEADAVVTMKLYFRDGHFLSFEYDAKAEGYEPIQFVGMVIDIGNTSTSISQRYINEIREIIDSGSYSDATFACDNAARQITADDIDSILSNLATSENFEMFIAENGENSYYFDNWNSAIPVPALGNNSYYLYNVKTVDGKITSIKLGQMYSSNVVIEFIYE